MSLASMAQSQELVGFDRSSFGSVVLPQTEAAIRDIQLELAVGDYKNEPIIKYSDRANFVKIGRSVGRLDVLTDKGMFPCTAFIVSPKYILTNYHCSLGILDNEKIGATRIDGTQFVAGYTRTGIEEGTKKYFVVPTPVEVNKALDYAVLEVIGDPSEEYGELKLASLIPEGGDPFWIIGHPMGEGQRISREDCRASLPAISKNTLLHTCDTYFGNSGSPVIDTTSQQVIALHHAGSLKDNVNYAILMSKILENSTVLAAYKAPDEVPKANAAEPKVAAISACEALYAEAKEAKACYAYNAYVQSCSGHSLAPIAKGYINKFCKPQETTKVAKAPDKTCDDDPSLCSTDQLCGQSLTFKSGKAAWRNGNISYVAEAKRRGLSCGVTEVVSKKMTGNKNELVCELENPEVFEAIEKEAGRRVFYGELARANLRTMRLVDDFLLYGQKKVSSCPSYLAVGHPWLAARVCVSPIAAAGADGIRLIVKARAPVKCCRAGVGVSWHLEYTCR